MSKIFYQLCYTILQNITFILSKITLQNSNAYNNNFNYEQLTSCQHLGNVKLQFNTWLTRTIKVLRYPINLTSDNFEIERFL